MKLAALPFTAFSIFLSPALYLPTKQPARLTIPLENCAVALGCLTNGFWEIRGWKRDRVEQTGEVVTVELMEETRLMAPTSTDEIIIEAKCTGAHWVLNAKWRRRRVGYIWATCTGKRLHLADFVVENLLPIPWSFLNGLRCLLRIRFRTRSFRGQGVGSRLMDTLLTEAKRAGITEIWGSVTEHDAKVTLHLLTWYEQRGFAVSAPDSECVPDAAKKIFMKLVA